MSESVGAFALLLELLALGTGLTINGETVSQDYLESYIHDCCRYPGGTYVARGSGGEVEFEYTGDQRWMLHW